MTIPCHILVEGNPAIMYASRNGTPAKVMRVLRRFLDTFSQERQTSGEYDDTPECLLAQLLVRFGFEFCEDDFSNLKVGLKYYSQADYLYQVGADYSVRVWSPLEAYRQNPDLGLEGCTDITQQIESAPQR
jgi:hypothetical protein